MLPKRFYSYYHTKRFLLSSKDMDLAIFCKRDLNDKNLDKALRSKKIKAQVDIILGTEKLTTFDEILSNLNHVTITEIDCVGTVCKVIKLLNIKTKLYVETNVLYPILEIEFEDYYWV